MVAKRIFIINPLFKNDAQYWFVNAAEERFPALQADRTKQNRPEKTGLHVVSLKMLVLLITAARSPITLAIAIFVCAITTAIVGRSRTNDNTGSTTDCSSSKGAAATANGTTSQRTKCSAANAITGSALFGL
jgi:hypothetical protein